MPVRAQSVSARSVQGVTALSIFVLVASLLLSVQPATAQDEGAEIISERVVVSTSTAPTRPLPADHTPIDLVVEVHRPATATAASPVPVILEGHGWGGSRQTDAGAFADYLAAGYAVVSIDQRGWGESGGPVTVMDPDQEGQDLIALVDWISAQEWVQTETPEAGSPFDRDPVMGAIGGSYGGGYQYLLHLVEQREFDGYSRIDALAPQITWFDLNDSLAPSRVARSAWLTLLQALGASRVDSYVNEGFAYGVATGNYPDGSVPLVVDLASELYRHGPVYHVEEGRQVDVPVLAYQGFSDNLFNFNQGWRTFTEALTDDARAQSQLIGFNGGHALPNVLPMGVANGTDACTGEGGFRARTLDFFDIVLRGAPGSPRVVGGGEALQYTTVDGECIRFETDQLQTQTREVSSATPIATSTVAGVPQHVEIPDVADLTVAGVPTVTATVTSLGVEQRVFLGLSVGTSPLDAAVIQNNLLPLNVPGPAEVGVPQTIELPGIAIEMEEGESLFLTISPVSDMFFAHGSRAPGVIVLEDVSVDLPTVADAPAEVPSSTGHFSRLR